MQSNVSNLETNIGGLSRICNNLRTQLRTQQTHLEERTQLLETTLENNGRQTMELVREMQQQHIEDIQTIHNMYTQTGMIGITILTALIGIGGYLIFRRMDTIQSTTPIIIAPQPTQIIENNNLLENTLIKTSVGIGVGAGIGIGAIILSILRK
jgi:hypothetical protein